MLGIWFNYSPSIRWTRTSEVRKSYLILMWSLPWLCSTDDCWRTASFRGYRSGRIAPNIKTHKCTLMCQITQRQSLVITLLIYFDVKKCAKYKNNYKLCWLIYYLKKDIKYGHSVIPIFQHITTYLSCFKVSRNRYHNTFIKYSTFVHLIGWTISDIVISVHLIYMKHLIYSSDIQWDSYTCNGYFDHEVW